MLLLLLLLIYTVDTCTITRITLCAFYSLNFPTTLHYVHETCLIRFYLLLYNLQTSKKPRPLSTIMANRRSAARSRARRLQYITDLENSVSLLRVRFHSVKQSLTTCFLSMYTKYTLSKCIEL